MIGSPGRYPRGVSRRFFALSEVTARIRELLAPAFGRRFWVRGEISSARERGHFYCDLVESDSAHGVVAQLRCTIWERDLQRIRAEFAKAGLDLALENGTQVGIECEVEFHPRYGLSLRGRDMDPAFALGELELRRRRILETLGKEGLLDRNARLAVAMLPNRIALVTSAGSAACLDFVETLSASPFGFQIFLAGATMQGQDTQRSILAALDACERLPVDLVVIARGGGSKTELAWLDDEIIARRIAGYPLPVWTGIGHEIDTGVLDAVAGQSFKTPTAVAEALVGRFVAVSRRLDEGAVRLRSVWRLRLRGASERLERAQTGLRQGTRKLVDQRRSELRRAAEAVRAEVRTRLGGEERRLARVGATLRVRALGRLREAELALGAAGRTLGASQRSRLREVSERLLARRERFSAKRVLARIARERERLAALESLLRAADPRTALARGFSLTTDASGSLVRSVAQALPGTIVETRVVDGSFESVVRTTRRDGDG